LKEFKNFLSAMMAEIWNDKPYVDKLGVYYSVEEDLCNFVIIVLPP
jgi:hypothetical protein